MDSSLGVLVTTCVECVHSHWQTNDRRQIFWMRPIWCSALSEYFPSDTKNCPAFKAK